LASLVDVREVEDDLRLLAREAGCAYSTDWEKAVASESTDVVAVCTSNEWHADMAITALAHGKHVLVEKPLANTLADAAKIVAEARTAGRFLKTGLNYRWREPIRRALGYLQEGMIGGLLHLRAEIGHSQFLDPAKRRSWYFNQALGGRGALLDLGVHMVDLARLALAIDHDALESVMAWTVAGRVLHPTTHEQLTAVTQVEEEGTAIFRSRKGCHFQLHASWVEPRKFLGARIEFTGERGRIETDLTAGTTRLVRRWHGLLLEDTTSFEPLDPDPSWIAELVALRDAILEGKPLEGDGADGLEAQRLVFAAYASAMAGGHPVRLEGFAADLVGKVDSRPYAPADRIMNRSEPGFSGEVVR
jgi:predicted dehydrogenase